MTLIQLNRYFDLINSLDKAKELLENLRIAACPGAQVLTGMPHAPGTRDKLGDLAVEIADMEIRIEYIENEIATHREAVERFVADIEDTYLRTIFRLRFERGLSWKEVSSTVGGGNTEDGVKSACYRYLKKLHRNDAS